MKPKSASRQLNVKNLILGLFSCFFVCGQVLAQDDLDEETLRSPETEMVCFAAQKEWVCAPADEQAQAREKALKLAQENPSDDIDLTVDNQVEITTLDLNQEIKPTMEQSSTRRMTRQDIVAQQVKDFTARKDVTKTPTVAVESQSNEPEPTVVEQPVTEVTATAVEPERTEVQIAEVNATDKFDDWQRNYADRWSFQVVGTSNRHHLDQFVVEHGLQGVPHSIVKTQTNGTDWWIVLVGLYETRAMALSQRDQLPLQLAGNAWVRQIKTIVGQSD